jgi:hypothetical protein
MLVKASTFRAGGVGDFGNVALDVGDQRARREWLLVAPSASG